jgi:hypothetical protein
LTSLNNLTRQVQFLATGTSGTDFNISSTTATHTFNLPVASATNTGKLSSTDWSTFNNKVPYTGATADVDLGIYGLSANLVTPKQIILKKDTILGGSISIETGSGFAWGGSNDTILLASGASNTLSLRSIVSSVLRTAILDFSTISAATSRTFTLPDDSGTLALTSNLSSYVPYTGATGAVDLGTNTLSAGNTKINDTLYLKLATTYAHISGYYGISVGTNIFVINNSASTQAVFSLASLTTSRTFTLPDASGTLALTSNLSSYVPYTGATASVNLGMYYLTAQFITGTGGFETGLGTGLYLRSNSTATYLSTGYVSLVSNNGNNFNIAYGSSTKEAILVGSGLTSSRSFTFPDASGTIALTSNLSAYLPLTGGTLTGQLNGTNTVFSGRMSADSGLLTNGLSFPHSGSRITAAGETSISVSGTNGIMIGFPSAQFSALAFPTASSNTYTFPNATGTIALTSNLSAYLPLAGGTLTGALSGTSATFSGSVTTNSNLVVNKLSDSDYLALKIENRPITNSNTSAGYIGFYSNPGNGSNNTLSTGRIYGKFDANSYAAARLTFSTVTGDDVYQDVMTLKGTNVGIGTSSPANTLHVSKAAYMGQTWSNTAVGGISAFLNVYDTTYGVSFGTEQSAYLQFVTNAAERMRITSGGNVLVNNTSSVGSKLIVKSDGTTSASFACIFWDSASSDLMYVRSDGYGYLKASAWVYGSDLRMKENVSNVENGLDMVLKMKPKHFDYINGQKNNIGFVAQDIQKIIPQAVSVTNEETGMLGLKTDFLVPYIAKAVQELKLEKDTEIAELKAQIEELKAMIAAK